MRFTLNRVAERLIDEARDEYGFDSPSEAVEFIHFSHTHPLLPFFRQRRFVDRELDRGAASGPPVPLEQVGRLSAKPSTTILITPAAKDDLTPVWKTVKAARSAYEADGFIVLLCSQLVVLVAHPELGTKWRGEYPRTRVLTVNGFGIFFRASERGIEVVRILPNTLSESPLH